MWLGMKTGEYGQLRSAGEGIREETVITTTKYTVLANTFFFKLLQTHHGKYLIRAGYQIAICHTEL